MSRFSRNNGILGLVEGSFSISTLLPHPPPPCFLLLQTLLTIYAVGLSHSLSKKKKNIKRWRGGGMEG